MTITYSYPRSEGVLRLIDAARVFVERVENGEVRSVTTYNQIKDALDLIDTPQPKGAK